MIIYFKTKPIVETQMQRLIFGYDGMPLWYKVSKIKIRIWHHIPHTHPVNIKHLANSKKHFSCYNLM